jgi:hypothetical protein
VCSLYLRGGKPPTFAAESWDLGHIRQNMQQNSRNCLPGYAYPTRVGPPEAPLGAHVGGNYTPDTLWGPLIPPRPLSAYRDVTKVP